MNGKAVSAALSALPEDMVAEAMEPAQRRRGFSWLRLAACIAIIIGLFFGFWPTEPEIVTAPGLLTLTVYAEETDGQGYVRKELHAGVSAVHSFEKECIIDGEAVDPPGVSIYFSLESDDFPSASVSYHICVNYGRCFDWSNGDYVQGLGRNFNRENHSWCTWGPYIAEIEDFSDPVYDHAYMDIIIYCEECIVGYAILRLDRIHNGTYPSVFYDPVMITSVIFPKQDGEYQNVSNEYVKSCIADVKENDTVK